MRVRKSQSGLTVNSIAGSHVVFFGLDLAASKRPGFRGFAFERTDHKKGETYWLRSTKSFKETAPNPAAGTKLSSRDHPFQAFQWADYSVAPGQKYTYNIVALYGDPANLQAKAQLTVDITTETETGPGHSAFFNRGSVATQEYARRFGNMKPNKVGQDAYDWLSRGLLKALLDFLGRAKKGWSIHGAVYEFQWPDVLARLKQVHLNGAVVKVLFDDIEAYQTNKKTGKKEPKGPFKKNRDAIAKAKIKSLCKGRANGKLMHNKFFVLSFKGKPKAVWTGSTNLTENGIFGHSNLGHIVEDETVAQAYMDYWNRLNDDPGIDKDYRDSNVQASPAPPVPWKGTAAVFSPRGTDLDSLNWYARLAGKAKGGLFMTFAFGMHEKFKDVYNKNDNILRMALLEKEGNNPKTLQRDKQDIQNIRNRPNVVLAIGNRIVTNAFDKWLSEMPQITAGVHVYWIHTKYMLVDPLGADPVVVTGSANFSKASTDTNDENMLAIHGDKRIADIYFGEYMRLYSHYAFREVVKWHTEKVAAGKPEDWKPQFLISNDSWMKPYFDPADRSGRRARREYFAGPMSV